METHWREMGHGGPLEGGGMGSESPIWVQTSSSLEFPMGFVHVPMVNAQ